MSLNDLELEQIAKIKNINCNNILKNRLYSLGITKGALIKVEKKNTYK
ncbi:FeoA family protein [Aliarcobacter butzleri]|nr:FeoA family protein [Aliarcobacter butzleri]